MQKFKKGDRVKVLVGHPVYQIGKWTDAYIQMVDIMPHLTEDVATVEYTYGEKSETDWRYSKGEAGYKSYSLKFDKYGSVSWFDEKIIIPVEQ